MRHKCKNCSTVYDGNFCPQCCRSAAEKRLGWKAVGMDILGGFINISCGFLHTIIRLPYFPGKMIRDFIGGKRADYFRPFQLSFVLAAIANIASRRYGILCGGYVVASLNPSGQPISKSHAIARTSQSKMQI